MHACYLIIAANDNDKSFTKIKNKKSLGSFKKEITADLEYLRFLYQSNILFNTDYLNIFAINFSGS